MTDYHAESGDHPVGAHVCAGCGRVHLKMGESRFTFSREAFLQMLEGFDKIGTELRASPIEETFSQEWSQIFADRRFLA